MKCLGFQSSLDWNEECHSSADMHCCGRFAPSPTGPLHFGSIVAAVASYLDAKTHGGEWLLRIDDLDPPREARGATDMILRALEALALQWDGQVLYQSQRSARYHAALDALQAAGAVYPCTCTRREIADSMLPVTGGAVYPGTCRNGSGANRGARALRVRTRGESIGFVDAVQGSVTQNVAREIGDFVLRRADGVFAYQLAVVVDDWDQGITHVVRGADLLSSTARQIHLQRLLGFPQPTYAHLPVAVNAEGEKLSKQTRAPAVDITRPADVLCAALSFLGQPLLAGLNRATAAEVLSSALENWRIDKVPRACTQTAPAIHARVAKD